MNKNNLWLDCEPYAIFPKIFFEGNKYQKLSSEAKILYIFLYDRAKFYSQTESFADNGEIYVFCTNKNAQKILNKSKQKTLNVFRELETNSLISRIPQENSRTYKIYVHKPTFS